MARPGPPRGKGSRAGPNDDSWPPGAARVHHHHRGLPPRHERRSGARPISGRRSTRRCSASRRRPARAFGGGPVPMLLSVRSGAKFSMPGMMDTILNLGINDEVVALLYGVVGRRSLRLGRPSPLRPDVRGCGARSRLHPVPGGAHRAEGIGWRQPTIPSCPPVTSRQPPGDSRRSSTKRGQANSRRARWISSRGRSPRCSSHGTRSGRSSTDGSTRSPTILGPPPTCR